MGRGVDVPRLPARTVVFLDAQVVVEQVALSQSAKPLAGASAVERAQPLLEPVRVRGVLALEHGTGYVQDCVFHAAKYTRVYSPVGFTHL